MPAKNKLAPILWPLGVVGMLGVSLSVCAFTVVAATSDKSFAVEDDYYAKAVAWDDTAAQRVRAALADQCVVSRTTNQCISAAT